MPSRAGSSAPRRPWARSSSRGRGRDDWSSLREWLVDGELPRVGGLHPHEATFSSPASWPTACSWASATRSRCSSSNPAKCPAATVFKIAGIFDSGMEEMDRALVITDIRNVQRLADWSPDEISGYEIRTRSLDEAEAFARTLGRTLLYDEGDGTENLAVESVTERYANIFDWLKAHDVNAAVIIVIMLVVAFFNMTSALLILVLERTRMIGLLKALGMRNGEIRRIFLWRAAFVTLRGLCWGKYRRRRPLPDPALDPPGQTRLGRLSPLRSPRGARLGLVAGAQCRIRRRHRRPVSDPDGRRRPCQTRRNHPLRMKPTIPIKPRRRRSADVRPYRAEIRPAQPYALDEHRPPVAPPRRE